MAANNGFSKKYATELCLKYPETSSLQLARMLREKHPKLFSSVELARKTIRVCRGASGERDRKRDKPTAPRKPGTVKDGAKMPPSLAEPWTKFDLGTKIRIGVMADIHIPYHDNNAFHLAVEFLKDAKINVLLLNGDFGDWYCASRFERKPDKRDFLVEIQQQKEALIFLYEQFPKARKVFKMGNHDERWDHLIWNRAPEFWGLSAIRIWNLLEFDKYGYEYVGDQRPIMAGELPILHGHELGKSIFSPVNPARGAFLRTHHTVMVSHSHQTSSHCDPNMFHDETFVWSTGCLCDLTPEYARVNRWNHGFAIVDVAQNGEVDVTNLRISKGRVKKS
jgi:predicted phosphodiesterase